MKTITQEQYFNAVSIIQAYHKQLLNQIVEIDKAKRLLENTDSASPVLLIDTAISVRLYNILKNNCNEIGLCDTHSEFWGWKKFGTITTNDLHRINIHKLRKCRNCGPSTISELETLCVKYGQEMDYTKTK
jgi:hypothetical protein